MDVIRESKHLRLCLFVSHESVVSTIDDRISVYQLIDTCGIPGGEPTELHFARLRTKERWTACLLVLACLASTGLILGLHDYYTYPALCLLLCLGVFTTWRIHVIMCSKCHRLYLTKIR